GPGGRPWWARGQRVDDCRRRPPGARGRARHLDHPDRVRIGGRSGQRRPGPELQSPRRQCDRGARKIDQRIVVANASDDAELESAFSSLIAPRVAALLVSAEPRAPVVTILKLAFSGQG